MISGATLPYVREQDIVAHVGSGAALRGKPYSRDGSLTELEWDRDDHGDPAAPAADGEGLLTGVVHGTSSVPYRTRIVLRPVSPAGDQEAGAAGVRRYLPVRSSCSCPVRMDCKHAAALMYRSTMDALRSTMSGSVREAVTPPRTAEPEWRRALAPLLGAGGPGVASALAIGVELLPVRRWHGYSHLAADQATPDDLASGVPWGCKRTCVL